MAIQISGQVTDVRIFAPREGQSGNGYATARLLDMGQDVSVSFSDAANAPKEGVWIAAQGKAQVSSYNNSHSVKFALTKWQPMQNPQAAR